MWESQVLLTDGQVVFLRVLRFSPTFDERSARYKWNILERAVKPKSKKKKKMIVLIPYIKLLNLSWIKKCFFLRNMEPLNKRCILRSNCSERTFWPLCTPFAIQTHKWVLWHVSQSIRYLFRFLLAFLFRILTKWMCSNILCSISDTSVMVAEYLRHGLLAVLSVLSGVVDTC